MAKKAKAKTTKYKKPAAQPLDEKQLDGVSGGNDDDLYCLTGYKATDACKQGRAATLGCASGGAEKPIR